MLLFASVMTSEGLPGLLGLLAVMVSLFAPAFGAAPAFGDGNRMAWQSEVIAEVEDSYGIKLTQEEFQELRFPAVEPDEDFVAYGSIPRTMKVGDTMAQETVTLIWSEGELFLGTTDGSTVVPLESVVG